MLRRRIHTIGPGLILTGAVSGLALLLGHLQAMLFGRVVVDGLVLAILIGTLVHTLVGLGPRFHPGVRFSAKTLLEIAIVLLGASISVAAIRETGVAMAATVAVVVVAAIGVSYAISRGLGLAPCLAALVACGNSICGNSAIVAAAPVIDASEEDVASAIAFTAALGILVVTLLPALAALGLEERRYGIMVGMTVYAVPQVLAATVPVGVLSTQIGTIVKLMRVMMLGPVVLALGLGWRRGGPRPPLSRLVPWFVLGFLGLIVARSVGLVPDAAVGPLDTTSRVLTTLAMAALGLTVNLKGVLAAGGRVLAAGALSILALATMAAVALTVLPTA
ncbi:YeiH family protein [Acuticoccus mangrovi]|uniref:Sulfate exporter family transporter n=1 Tax=Acuticoccus mangrovi TaxID=2796142 RepID=A0A934IKU0_9HYPH|nr:putative sulfate exporter family transporter [Acuticoccus mangrovi]MBJ3774186.1 putative sulfate exporter family transporter [Acuticoccus mangrovi]